MIDRATIEERFFPELRTAAVVRRAGHRTGRDNRVRTGQNLQLRIAAADIAQIAGQRRTARDGGRFGRLFEKAGNGGLVRIERDLSKFGVLLALLGGDLLQDDLVQIAGVQVADQQQRIQIGLGDLDVSFDQALMRAEVTVQV